MATRWGICSAGKISHDFTVALKTLPLRDHQVLIVAVAAQKLQDAQEFAKKHSIRQAYGSYEELARDPEIEVVYVGTIHPYHLPVGMIFMKAQKNVLCEKPMAMNLREVQELMASAKMNQVFLMEAVWTCFFPASLEIERLLSRGEVGEVKMVKADFGAPLMHVPRAVEKELLDIGIYCLQFISTGVCMDTGSETSFTYWRYPTSALHIWGYPTSALPIGDILLVLTYWGYPTSALPIWDILLTQSLAILVCPVGLKESPRISQADSLQVGVVYSQDCQ
uniref:Trans-1,2-dihydrobenzene-1,2-diol dehydrogenase n=1 Tax=Salmo trutta TaxID=8032 RepID=A0A673XLV3_SALTR